MVGGRRSSNRINRALAIKQTGARVAGIKKGKTVFRLGGGLFTGPELVKARKRFGKGMGFVVTAKNNRKGLM